VGIEGVKDAPKTSDDEFFRLVIYSERCWEI